jgi:hypothetical protein
MMDYHISLHWKITHIILHTEEPVHLFTLFLILKSSPTYSPTNHTVDSVLCSSNMFNYPEDISICGTSHVTCNIRRQWCFFQEWVLWGQQLWN